MVAADFEEIVNNHHLSSGYFKMLIDEVTQDGTFERSLSGELYQDYLKVQLWFVHHKDRYAGIHEFGSTYDSLLRLLDREYTDLGGDEDEDDKDL